IYGAQGNVAESRREIALAREQHATPAALEEADAVNRRLDRRALIWKVPIGIVLALGLGVLVLYAAGGALSAVDMRRLRDVRSGAARLDGEATASERLIHR